MMMECPRCGFAQPKDRYCASCGLDVDNYVAKPKPLWIRTVQNPTLHLSLIGILIFLVIGYIFYAQRELVSREVGHLFNGLPLLSRDAADPDAPPGRTAIDVGDEEEGDESENLPPTPTEPAPVPAVAAAIAPDKAIEAQKIEVTSWEVSREALTGLLNGAEKVGESTAGRAYLWAQGSKVSEALKTSGRRLTASRSLPTAQIGGQLAIEAQTQPTDPFQFGLYFQVSKVENKEVTIKWDSTLIMPVNDTATEASISGSTTLSNQSALLLVFEPTSRAVREDFVTKAGEGPWSILTSEEFRSGTTEWVVLVQLL